MDLWVLHLGGETKWERLKDAAPCGSIKDMIQSQNTSIFLCENEILLCALCDEKSAILNYNLSINFLLSERIEYCIEEDSWTEGVLIENTPQNRGSQNSKNSD